MLRQTSCAALLVLGGLTAGVAAEVKSVKLEWQFKEGDKFYVENVSRQGQTVKMSGMTLKQNITFTVVSRFTVQKKTRAGVVLEQKVESARLEGADEIGGVARLVGRMKGAIFRVTLDPAGKITLFTGYTDLVRKLSQDDKKAAPQFRQLVSEDELKEQDAEIFSFLPSKAVARDSKWTREWKVSARGLGSFKAKSNYTYLGRTREGDRIDFRTSGEFVPAAGSDNGLKITRAKLKLRNARGNILFDADRGWPVRYRLDMEIKGPLTLTVAGRKFEAELEVIATSTIRVTDKLPAGR